MKTITLLCSILFAASLHAVDPFSFAAPPDWRAERIPFPLGFAPGLKYKGFEELRFGPGMFEPKSDTYWTYVFFWWLEGEQKLSRASLESDLVAYYRGLSVAVGGSRRFLIDARKITAVLAPHTTTSASPAGFAPAFTGTLQTYDAFVTGRLIQLHVEVSHRYFPGSDRTWVFFSVSPRDPGVAVEAETWTRMRRIRDSFKVE